MQYWLRLSSGQKESLLNVAKNFVGLRDRDKTTVTDLRKEIIQEEREKYLRGEGQSFSWEEVKNLARHKDQRNAF